MTFKKRDFPSVRVGKRVTKTAAGAIKCAICHNTVSFFCNVAGGITYTFDVPSEVVL